MAILTNNGKTFTLNGTAISFNPPISGSWTLLKSYTLPEGKEISATGLSFYITERPDRIYEGIVVTRNKDTGVIFYKGSSEFSYVGVDDINLYFQTPVNRADNPEFYDWFVANATPMA